MHQVQLWLQDEEYSKGLQIEYSIRANTQEVLGWIVDDTCFEFVHQPYFDGVMYPSTRMGGQAGMNIALKPEAADSSLDLKNVGEPL